jgi:5-methyltetrahydrofolate--homocysteine methyltransferase
VPSPATLESLLAERILVLDGAMGTELQRLGLGEADFRGARFRNHPHDLLGNYDALSLTQPDRVARVHLEYLAAGSDLIRTNTFGSAAVVQAGYGLASMAYELNVAAARLAKAACETWTARTPRQPRFVAGTIGPTNRSASVAPGIHGPGLPGIAFAQLEDAYQEQVRGLIDGGCDLLIVETVFDVLNAEAALAAIDAVGAEKSRRLPVMLSATVSNPEGRMLDGRSVTALWTAVAPSKPLSIGLNCSAGAAAMRPHLEMLARLADCCVSCHPSAGLPNALGEYETRPAALAKAVRDFASRRLVNIVGGCCGTTPQYIRAMVKAVADLTPRAVAG